MALDLDNLGAAPDIDNIDIAAMDRGDMLPEAKVEQVEETVEEVSEEQIEEELDLKKGEEVEEVEDDKEEQPRDEKGKFTGKGVIPVERHKATLDKEREAREAAEKKAADLERQLYQREQEQAQQIDRNAAVAELETQIDTLTKQQHEAVLDGDADKAAEISKQIRQLDRQIARAEAQEESNATVNVALEKQRLQVTIAQIEADFPALNPQSETYDPDLVQLILLAQRDMVNNGMPASQAMAESTGRIMRRFVRETVEVKEEPKGLSKAEIEDRKKAQVEKALSAQQKQPSSMKESGMDSDKAGERGLPDVSKLTMEEYSALPEATRARLRGDLV